MIVEKTGDGLVIKEEYVPKDRIDFVIHENEMSQIISDLQKEKHTINECSIRIGENLSEIETRFTDKNKGVVKKFKRTVDFTSCQLYKTEKNKLPVVYLGLTIQKNLLAHSRALLDRFYMLKNNPRTQKETEIEVLIPIGYITHLSTKKTTI